MTLREALTKWNAGNSENATTNFAEKLGVKVQNVSSWTTGKNAPKHGMRVKIAKELKISVQDLNAILDASKAEAVRRPGQSKGISGIIPARFVPVIGVISSVLFSCDIDGAMPIEILPVPLDYGNKRVFALKVCGNAIKNIAVDGEYVFIVAVNNASDGHVAMVRLAGGYSLHRIGPETQGKGDIVGVVAWCGRKP